MFNEDNNQNAAAYSPFRRGAEDGLFFGVYLSVLTLCMLAGFRHAFLELIFLVMAVGVPFWCFNRQRRSYVASAGALTVAPLWMQGIIMFICGSIIACVVSVAYLSWIDPAYFADLKDLVAEGIAADPAMLKASGVREADIDNLFSLITPVKFAVEMLWLSIFTGSILSLLMAVLVPLKRIPNSK